MPQARQAVDAVNLADERDGAGRAGRGGGVQRGRGARDALLERGGADHLWDLLDLHLALYQLDGGQDEACEGAACGAAEEQGVHGELLVGMGVVEEHGLGGLLGDVVAEEEGAVFDGGADERGGDAPVETADSAAGERLLEAVEGPFVSEGTVIGLGLETDLEGGGEERRLEKGSS